MHYTYILQSKKTNKYYCGECQNILDRLERHNSGRSKYTKHGVPWKVVKLLELVNRTEARKLETTIKSSGIERWLIDNS